MLKNTILKQYRDLIYNSTNLMIDCVLPNEGWCRTVRKALNMSGSQLASRVGSNKAWISRTEKAELDGAVTLRTMEKMAEAMDCKFVYAFVPKKNIEELIEQQAYKKAQSAIYKANSQMALEAQAVSEEKLQQDINKLAEQFIANMPTDFWDDD